MGRGLSAQQLAILRLTDQRRQAASLDPVMWEISLMQDVPKPIADLWAERLKDVYRNFVPERKLDLYFKPELKVREHVDVLRLLDGLFLTGKEHEAVRDACGTDWQADAFEALVMLGKSKYGNSVIALGAEAGIVARHAIGGILKKGGFEPIPEDPDDGLFTVPQHWSGRWVSMYPYKKCQSRAEADALQAKLTPLFGQNGAADVTYQKKWHVTVNALMAEVGGLREHILHRGADATLNGGYCFDHSVMPAAKYNAARATITRACSRLASRNLIVRNYQGDRELYESAAIAITVDGVAALTDGNREAAA